MHKISRPVSCRIAVLFLALDIIQIHQKVSRMEKLFKKLNKFMNKQVAEAASGLELRFKGTS